MSTTHLAVPFGMLALLAGTAPSQPALATVRVATGFAKPLYVTTPAGDYDRLFVVEQSTGRIRIVVGEGTILSQPFLDIGNLIWTGGGERGLLGLAFHPDYANNGEFFVYYTRAGDGASIVERFDVSANDPNVADPQSGTIILGPISQPYSNHNGGQLSFGPDGYLYLGLGDGGSGGDPACRAQNLGVMLGKILRIDVDGGSPYAIPPSNPFVGTAGALPEIWAYGLRNPFRFSFDRQNGDLYIGDVGQNAREEVSWQSGQSAGGLNFGWKIMEGFNCYSTASCAPNTPQCNDPSLTLPIHDYGHSAGNNCIIGGYVYRGCALPGLEGTYFFGDNGSGRIWSLQYDGTKVSNLVDRTSELVSLNGGTIDSISSFGEDANGEIYITDLDGELYRIVAASGSPAKNLGNATVGGNGLKPRFEVCGLLGAGQQAQFVLRNAAANAPAAMLVSDMSNPTTFGFGTVVPVPPALILNGNTDSTGRYETTIQGGLGPAVLYAQWLVLDPGATAGIALSNALQITWP